MNEGEKKKNRCQKLETDGKNLKERKGRER